MQKYLESDQIFTHRKKLLVKIRTHMLNVNYNYGKQTKCPLCLTEEDTQSHLIECSIIKDHFPELNSNDVKIQDALDADLAKADKVSKTIEQIMQKRAELLETDTSS